MNEKILVVGGNSFLGKNILENKSKKGSFYYTTTKKDTEHIHFDLTNQDFSQIKSINPSSIIFLASISSPSRVDVDKKMAFNINVNMFDNFLDYIFTNLKINKFIYASTVAVYGFSEETITESSETNPDSYYGLTKELAEKLTAYYCEKNNVNYNILRFSNMYGSYQQYLKKDIPTFIPDIVVNALKNKEISVIRGDLNRNFLYVDDGVEAILKCINSNHQGTFNVSGFDSTTGEIGKKLSSILGYKLNIREKGTDSKGTRFSSHKFREVFDWSPKVDLEEGLKRTVDYYKHKLQMEGNK